MIEIRYNGTCVWREPLIEYELPVKTVVTEAKDVIPFLECIRTCAQEHFLVLSLDSANRVFNSRVITIGLLNSNQVHPREVFAESVAERAAAVIVAHNHPSGTLAASPEDIAVTKRLRKAGEILGISVLDHIIISPAGWLSFKQDGLIE